MRNGMVIIHQTDMDTNWKAVQTHTIRILLSTQFYSPRKSWRIWRIIIKARKQSRQKQRNNWRTLQRTGYEFERRNSPVSPASERLIEIIDHHDLYQDVNKPTRRTETSNNILDVVFSSISSVIGDVKVVPGISDHDIVFFTVNLSCHRKKIAKRKIYIRDAAMTKPRPNWLIVDGLPLLLVHLRFIRGGKDSSVSQSAIP